MWGRRGSTTTTKNMARGIVVGGEVETARPLPTLYYHSPSLHTLYFLSPFLILRYFVLYSQKMWRGLSLFFWSQALEKVIFQGSQSLNEAIWAQIKSTFSFIFTQTPSEDLHDTLYDSMIYTFEVSVEGTEDGKLGVVDNLITYQLEIYPSCECTYNVSKEKYVCTIFAVLISLYVTSQLNGFHELMVFTFILFMNTRENIFKRKTVSKSAPSRESSVI